MMNADPFIADATSAQDFNRYCYVRNNPLKYTDPSGYCPWPFRWLCRDPKLHNPNLLPRGTKDALIDISGKDVSWWVDNYSFIGPLSLETYSAPGSIGMPGSTGTLGGGPAPESGDPPVGNVGLQRSSFSLMNKKPSFNYSFPSSIDNINSQRLFNYSDMFSIGAGAMGYRIGSHMSNISRLGPMYYNNGNIYRQAALGYRYGMIPGNTAVKLGGCLRFGGGVLGAYGLVNSSIRFYNNPSVKGGFDIGFGIIGFMGPIGLGIYGIYFIGDTFLPGGWEATPERMYNFIEHNSKDGIFMTPHLHF
jgi:hypothetical protein